MPRPRDEQPTTQALLTVLERLAPRPLSIREIAGRLALERYDRDQIRDRLESAVAERRLRRIGRDRYQYRLPERGPAAGGRADQRGSPRAMPGRAHEPRGRATGGGVRGAPHVAADRRPGAGRDVGGRAPREWQPRAPGPQIEGRYVRARGGFGFVAPEGEARRELHCDVLIPVGREGPALHGDRVRVEVGRHDRALRRASGSVVEVLERVNHIVVGLLVNEAWARSSSEAGLARLARRGPGAVPTRRWWVVPQSDRLPIVDITGGIEPSSFDAGKLALVRLTRQPDGLRGPAGELERVLGDAEDPEVQLLTIALESGLRIEFPPEVLADAARLPEDPSAEDVAARDDLRTLPFVTIDGETARDFDDAVCLEAMPGGGHRLRVAIADVAHYVAPGSPLDAEALARGTSVYFPDRAIPMLPEALSSGLCSLVPGRDRLVVVAELEIDRSGRRTAVHLRRGVIRSRARLTYTQVAAVLSGTDTAALRELREQLAEILPELRRMHALMRVLHRRRLAAGSLDLDLPEAMVDLSEEGRSIGVRVAPRNDAHRIIEEFMLEANQAVARLLAEHDLPFPYRVHEPPDPAHVDELNVLLGAFGARVEYQGEVRPRDVQIALRTIAGHPLAAVLSRHVLRALTQARYDVDNVGHFGLAFPVYCHFTSPIRRYPDLLVHRQVGAVLDGALEAARARAAELAAASQSSSERERRAMEAERAMLDLKRAEFMLDHLLEPEPATIVSVAKFGFFAELEACPVEGLVPLDSLPERFELDERAHALVGLRTRARLRLGDRVLVEATDVSLRRRQVTFALIERLTGAAEAAAPRVTRRVRTSRPGDGPRRERRRG